MASLSPEQRGPSLSSLRWPIDMSRINPNPNRSDIEAASKAALLLTREFGVDTLTGCTAKQSKH